MFAQALMNSHSCYLPINTILSHFLRLGWKMIRTYLITLTYPGIILNTKTETSNEGVELFKVSLYKSFEVDKFWNDRIWKRQDWHVQHWGNLAFLIESWTVVHFKCDVVKHELQSRRLVLTRTVFSQTGHTVALLRGGGRYSNK